MATNAKERGDEVNTAPSASIADEMAQFLRAIADGPVDVERARALVQRYTDARAMEASADLPRIVVEVAGGAVVSVSATSRVGLIVADYDTEGFEGTAVVDHCDGGGPEAVMFIVPGVEVDELRVDRLWSAHDAVANVLSDSPFAAP